ncbi:hypothetical protein DH2020_009783 [Rehmannia glutinosa]|uniref:Trehalose 6-phosphate phosphatase n=1 Tax=Rehmannia glutinosa TaxID=99300 RepID=A0ABR0X9X5_REHGL
MTNQNVVVSDGKSGINMAITVAVAGTSLFNTAAQKPPPAPGTYITISKKKLLQNLDINSGGGARINAWVDSMRASSPTHIKSAAISDDQTSWTIHHPSALDMFEQITNASKGKQIVMFLDYDGTLSPIVDDPDRAFMSESMRATVRKLARYFPTAIVSGRCRDKGAQAVMCQPASEYLPMIDEVYKALLEVTKDTPGAKVENNKFCLSVHFRCVDEKKWSELAKQVGSVLEGYPDLRLTQGRKVLEIRPTIKWDKGKALEFLLESLGDGIFATFSRLEKVVLKKAIQNEKTT